MSGKYKRIISIIALIIVIVFVVGSIILPILPVNASSLSALQNKYDQLERQRKQVQQNISANKNKQVDANAQKQEIQQNIDITTQQIGILNDQISALNSRLDTLNQQIGAKQKLIDDTQKKIDYNYNLFKQRICALYMTGSYSTIDVLLSSENITDFLLRDQILKSVSIHDNNLLSDLRTEMKAVREAKAQLEQSKASVEQTKAQRSSKQASISAKQDDLNSQYQDQMNLISSLKNDASDLAALSDRLEKQLEATDRAIEDLARQSQGSYTGGQFLWPIQSMSTYISSPFGPRTDPYTHKVGSFHQGIDITGSNINRHPILAANSGTVKLAEHSGSYGNYVILDHGGGVMTLYGHMTNYIVSTGQSVKIGQVIGYVGSTGWSTGPHLHFGVLKNGTFINPLSCTYSHPYGK